MKLKNENILFLTRTMQLGGTENVILQLCEIFKPLVNKIVVCSCGGINVKKLEEMGISHYFIPDIATKNPVSMLLNLFSINSIIKDEQITVIHSHHRMAALYTQLVGKRLIKIANAHNTFHDKRRMTRWAYKGTNIIAVGEMVKKNLIDFYGLPLSQITVIHNAVRPYDYNCVEIKEIVQKREQGYTLIGNVGRLSEQKGMEYFIDACRMVYHADPNARFFIIGDGEDRDKLKVRAEEVLPEEVLIFLGYRSDIQNIISQLDFLVLSSLWEGLPLTPIEAYSVGKTVIATAVDGTVEIVRHNIDGYLVEAKNAEVLAEKMLYLIKHPEVREQLGKNAMQRYSEKFSFDRLAKSYVEYYRGVYRI